MRQTPESIATIVSPPLIADFVDRATFAERRERLKAAIQQMLLMTQPETDVNQRSQSLEQGILKSLRA
jgi:hypothetical protein